MQYRLFTAIFLMACGAAGPTTLAQSEPPKPKKPSISVRATPVMSFAPAKIVFSVDLKGGSDDYEEFYCATTAWDWGDGTQSENATDCEPFEPGKSQIRRHFSAQHRYDAAGEYRVIFSLKRSGKTVGTGTTTVRVRPGLRDIGQP